MTTSTTTASRLDLYRAGLRLEHSLKDCRVDNEVLNLKLTARSSTAAVIMLPGVDHYADVKGIDYVIFGAVALVALKLLLWRR